jgi:hypothetical protein
MNIEKIIKRENGDRIRVNVSIGVSSIGDTYCRVMVEICPKGKRKFRNVHDSNDFDWRRLNLDDRAIAVKRTQLVHVTPEEVNSVIREGLDEAFNSIKW